MPKPPVVEVLKPPAVEIKPITKAELKQPVTQPLPGLFRIAALERARKAKPAAG